MMAILQRYPYIITIDGEEAYCRGGTSSWALRRGMKLKVFVPVRD